jgi:hypothetical protein
MLMAADDPIDHEPRSNQGSHKGLGQDFRGGRDRSHGTGKRSRALFGEARPCDNGRRSRT